MVWRESAAPHPYCRLRSFHFLKARREPTDGYDYHDARGILRVLDA